MSGEWIIGRKMQKEQWQKNAERAMREDIENRNKMTFLRFQRGETSERHPLSSGLYQDEV